MEELYGHPLSDLNLRDIHSWRVQDADWWLDYDRNLAAFEKRLQLQYHASNTVETLGDARQHEELFGFEYQEDGDLGLFAGVLEHPRRLRPDMIVLTDEIEKFALRVLEPHIPDWGHLVSFWELIHLASDLSRNPEVLDQLGHLDYLEYWHKLSTTELRKEARIFIYKALYHLRPDLRDPPSAVAARRVAEIEEFAAALEGYGGVDPREAFDHFTRQKQRDRFDTTYDRVRAFFDPLPEQQKQAFLLFMLNDRLWNEVESRYVVPSETNRAILGEVDASIHGRDPDFSTRSLAPRLGTFTKTVSNLDNLRLVRAKDILYDIADPDLVEEPGEAVLKLKGEQGPRIEIETNVPFLLSLLSAMVVYDPILHVYDNRTKQIGAAYSQSNDQSKTCFGLAVEGEASFSWTEGLTTLFRKGCSLEASDVLRSFRVDKGGWYAVKPNVTTRISSIVSSLSASTPEISIEGGAKIKFLTEGKVNLSAPSFSFDLDTSLFDAADVVPRGEKTNVIKFKRCSHEPGGRSAEDPPVCDESCPQGMVDSEIGCRCEAGLVVSEDEEGERICVEPCEADPSLCEPPGTGGSILVDLRPDVPFGPDDGILWPDWYSGLPDREEECRKVTAMVCTEVFIGGVVQVECEVKLVCADGGQPKRIDCTKGHWWPYCRPDTEFVGEMPAHAFCAPGERRCLDSSTAQTCRAEGFWGPIEACANGCETGQGACRSEAGPTECEAGQQRCVGEDSVQICESFQWGDAQPCPNGCEAGSGACLPPQTCAAGERRCSLEGTAVQSCQEGAWGSHTTCSYGCDSSTATCYTSAVDCSGSYGVACEVAGERSCNGFANVLVCDFNELGCLIWQSAESCENGCSDGACHGGCSGADLCNSEGASRCDGAASLESCQPAADGCLRWVSAGACASGETCHGGMCGAMACTGHGDCWQSSRSCQNGFCAPCTTDADCGLPPWVCSQTTQKCYAAF